MHAALLTVFLLGVGQATDSAGHAWHKSYGDALEATRAAGKPLLIVIDNPEETAQRLAQLDALVSLVAASGSNPLRNYVLCRVDVRTRYGKAVAEAFRTTTFPHTVVIDRTGSVKLFKKTGQFTASQWTGMLTRYQDGVRPQPAVYQAPIICST